MDVRIIKFPKDDDWAFVFQCAVVTVGKDIKNHVPSMHWKHDILKAKHSPIRTLQFAFEITDLPYWVSTHLVRHVHAQPFVRSQRNDRQNDYDRTKAPQDAPVNMIWYMNADELITIAQKRLCKQASVETQEVVRRIVELVEAECPEFKGLLLPMCERYGCCDEIKPCGRLNKND